MADKPMTKKEADAARKALLDFDKAEARAEYDARVAPFAPLMDLVASEGFKETKAALAAIDATQMPGAERFTATLANLMDAMESWVAQTTAKPPILMDTPRP